MYVVLPQRTLCQWQSRPENRLSPIFRLVLWTTMFPLVDERKDEREVTSEGGVNKFLM